MKDFIPKKQVETLLEKIHDRVAENLLNAIETPMTSEECYKFLGYPTKKSFQNDIRRIPHHKAKNGKYYFFKSQLNEWIKDNKAA